MSVFFAYRGGEIFFVEIFRRNHTNGEGMIHHERSGISEAVTQPRRGRDPWVALCDDAGARKMTRRANAIVMGCFPVEAGEITC